MLEVRILRFIFIKIHNIKKYQKVSKSIKKVSKSIKKVSKK